MIVENKWQPKKYGRPVKVLKVFKVDYAADRYAIEVEQRAFKNQEAGIIGRYYVEANDEMEAYMKASKGDFNVY